MKSDSESEVTSRPIRWHRNTHIHRHMHIELLLGGISGHKLTVNHTLTFLTMKHTHTFSHAVSHHFGLTSSGNEWRLCFKDELTHMEKMGGILLVSNCVQHHAGSPESTRYCFFKKHFRGNLVHHVLGV